MKNGENRHRIRGILKYLHKLTKNQNLEILLEVLGVRLRCNGCSKCKWEVLECSEREWADLYLDLPGDDDDDDIFFVKI